jgi:hypothetical protein
VSRVRGALSRARDAITWRRVLAAVASIALVAAGLAAGYVIGRGSSSLPQGTDAARAEAAAEAAGGAFRDGFAAGRRQGDSAGELAGTLAGLGPGAKQGGVEGGSAARKLAAAGPALLPAASATTRSEAEAEAPSRLAGDGGVLVVGDSLEVLTSPYLKNYLPPSVHLTINAEGGYNSLQIYDLFQQSYDPSQSVIVFDAGTNDNPAYPQILQGRLEAVASEIGNRCMVVPTIHGFTVDGVGNEGKNRVVESFAASRPGTQTPDWAGFEASHPELMQSDDLHPIAAGADARARLIAEGIAACLAY